MSTPTGVPVQVLPAGEEALLVEVGDLDDVLALRAALLPAAEDGSGPWAAVTDVVPAARTVLVLAGPGADLDGLARSVRGLAARAVSDGQRHPSGEAAVVELAVRYDGPDLAEVADLTGLTPAEVVAAHTGRPWTVAFAGFAPGFGYLVGGDPRLRVPRREVSRPSVPAGSVGLAGEFSGIYPRPSPGGWQLIGSTDAVLWDVERDPPALLAPGRTVRFVDAGAGS